MHRLYPETSISLFTCVAYCLFCCVDTRKSLPITTTTTIVHYLHPNSDFYSCWRTLPKRSCLLSHFLRLCCLRPIGRGTWFSVTLSLSLLPQRKSQSKAKVSLTILFCCHLCNPRSSASLLVLFSLESQNKAPWVNILFVSSIFRILFYFCVLCTRWISRSPIIAKHQP